MTLFAYFTHEYIIHVIISYAAVEFTPYLVVEEKECQAKESSFWDLMTKLFVQNDNEGALDLVTAAFWVNTMRNCEKNCSINQDFAIKM